MARIGSSVVASTATERDTINGRRGLGSFSHGWYIYICFYHAFYGEVYFALCNLKPCVMLTGIPHHLQPSFLQNVIRASNVLDLNMLSLVQAGPVSTLSFDFSGTFVLVTLGHPFASELVVALSTPTSMQVSETTVARWLDYPVALDTCVDTSAMVEIGYFDITTDQLVTSYCATFHDPNHRRQILDHFQRYTQTLGSILQLRRDATSV
ncbi:hypothetical protein DYB37_003956 [Aphanomyces astaci]|uniref:Uncharacterized protein n=1 Tax=Aphanomyces astaci TaxID=112090 RepID=A0A3R7AKA4_APHAT|nr:hypothetical protein DYB35_005240 [Aphanomyces astaci]RHZ15280.1 hypothetical protein DYB37_003956 [Aphanomyces astaci]